MEELTLAIETMKQRLTDILAPCMPTVYLYGSIPLHDFRLGWSDIDILVLTEKPISEGQAQTLVTLRQAMLTEGPHNPYYRSFEGGMLTLKAFLSGEKDRVVYWGTSGERITDTYALDAFCMCELLDSGVLLSGDDIRDTLPRPSFEALKTNVQKHYEAIRKYAQKTERNFYSFGWLLDISRCIYTLRTGKIIAKTAAGEWALKENLCPCAGALAEAVKIRKEPMKYREDKTVFDYAETLGSTVQRYADILQQELNRRRPTV